MQIKELPNAGKWTGRLYRKAKMRGILYPEMKSILTERYEVASSSDLTMEQYKEIRAIIRAIPVLPKVVLNLTKKL